MSAGPARQRRFPVDALRRALASESVTELARTCGVTQRSIHRYIHDGVPEAMTDAMAVRAGFHPAEVWPEWIEQAS